MKERKPYKEPFRRTISGFQSLTIPGHGNTFPPLNTRDTTSWPTDSSHGWLKFRPLTETHGQVVSCHFVSENLRQQIRIDCRQTAYPKVHMATKSLIVYHASDFIRTLQRTTVKLAAFPERRSPGQFAACVFWLFNMAALRLWRFSLHLTWLELRSARLRPSRS